MTRNAWRNFMQPRVDRSCHVTMSFIASCLGATSRQARNPYVLCRGYGFRACRIRSRIDLKIGTLNEMRPSATSNVRLRPSIGRRKATQSCACFPEAAVHIDKSVGVADVALKFPSSHRFKRPFGVHRRGRAPDQPQGYDNRSSIVRLAISRQIRQGAHEADEGCALIFYHSPSSRLALKPCRAVDKRRYDE
jgi:hypothetical protein